MRLKLNLYNQLFLMFCLLFVSHSISAQTLYEMPVGIQSRMATRLAIDLGNKLKFIIEAPNASATNKYVQSATLNGKPLMRARLTHAEISRGGKLVLQMSDKPSSWGNVHRPPSMSN